MPLELESKTAKKVLKKKVADKDAASEPSAKKKVVKKVVKAAAKSTKPTTKTKARKAKTKKAVSKRKPVKVAKKTVAKKKVVKKAKPVAKKKAAKKVVKAGKTDKARKAGKKDATGGLIGGRSKNKGVEGQRANGWGANWDIYELFSKKFFTEEEALEELKDKKAFKGKGKKRNLATIHRILGGMRRGAYSQYEDYKVEERAGNKFKITER